MSSTQSINPFIYWPYADHKKTYKKMIDPINGIHFFFRKVKIPLQALLFEYLDHKTAPQVFIFGSPHIDNYTRTHLGCGLIDFDRAIYGPYFSDLAYALISMSLKQKVDYTQPLNDTLINQLFRSYQQGLAKPELAIPDMPLLTEQKLEPWQKNVHHYIEAKTGWVKKAYKSPLPKDHPMLLELLHQFFENASIPETSKDQEIIHIGYGKGSMGRDHYIFLICHREDQDRIRILDIKPAKDYRTHLWPHGEYYSHPFEHEGERMIFATETLAPHMKDLESTASLHGVQYWGRSVPITQCKIKPLLDDQSLYDFASAAGVQMGQAHARTAQDVQVISQHLDHHKDALINCVQHAHQQIVEAWRLYCQI